MKQNLSNFSSTTINTTTNINPIPPLNQSNQPLPSSGAANLTNAVINLNSIRDYGRKCLIEVLDSVRGKKGLVLDPKFSGPLGLIAEVSLLKEHGVEKIYHLTPGKLETECKNLIYIIRPRIQLVKYIAENIHFHEKEGQKKEYSIFFVPRRTMICEKVLEEEELESTYKECFLEGDKTSLFYVARSLMRLQSIFGIIPHIKAKGNCSKLVVDMLLRMRREMDLDEPPINPEVDQLILIDREVDMITPFCTQLTYEGLIDEIFGINNTYVDLDPEIVGNTKGGKKIKTPLNSNDKVYSELRNLNFSVIGPLLNKKAKEIEEYYKQAHGAQTVTQLRDFVKRFSTTQQEYASLKIHTGITEKILSITKDPNFRKHLEAEQSLLAGDSLNNEYIEECIDKQEPLLKVLRLLCLQSLTNNGIKSKQLEFFKREILQTYGYQTVFTLNNLEKLGLLKKSEGKNTFNSLRKHLNLIVDIDENNPSDIAYVYSGYAPLSVRLIQLAFKTGGWKGKDEIMKLLPGPTIEENQILPSKIQEKIITNPTNNHSKNFITLVFYIGGVTFTEIASLRWLTQQGNQYGDMLIATTKLINGNSLLNTIFEI